MNVCIVGNGACALYKKNGTFIDSCDLVVRLGEFVIEGWEEYIGTKTDVYLSRWHKSKNRTKEFFESLKELWIPKPYEYREKTYDALISSYGITSKIRYIPKSLIFSYKARYPFRYVTASENRIRERHLYCYVPDSGIVAIDMVKYFYPDSTCWITGFDNCSSGYYWNVDKQLDLADPPILEFQLLYLKEMISSKKIFNLSDSL